MQNGMKITTDIPSIIVNTKLNNSLSIFSYGFLRFCNNCLNRGSEIFFYFSYKEHKLCTSHILMYSYSPL
uniref:Uncharacterized protein n=1 Tax=Lepeophtheirus salmonis TaxID=72036 RepID=A0A0K2TU79_LEPSM